MAIIYGNSVDKKKKPGTQSVTSTGGSTGGTTAGGGGSGKKPPKPVTGSGVIGTQNISGVTGSGGTPMTSGGKYPYATPTPGTSPLGNGGQLTGGYRPGVTIGANGQPVATGSPLPGQTYLGLHGLTGEVASGIRQGLDGYKPSAQVQQAYEELLRIQGARPGDFTYSRQGQLDDIYNQILNRGPYDDPYAGQIGEMQDRILNRGPYTDPLQADADALRQQINGRGPYQSRYDDELTRLMGEIQGREPFKYDLNADMLYQNYADQYQEMGRQAMMDTQGQAAALTGGYGNSYAASAGNQAYQQYLTQLNQMIPQLYDRAYQQYQDQGNELYNQWGLVNNMDERDYGRYQDAGNDLYNRLNMTNEERERGYGRYMDEGNELRNNLGMLNDASDRGYGRYMDEGSELYNRAGMLNNDRTQEYGQYQDRLNQWNTDREFAQGRYTDDRNFDYGGYRDNMGDLYNLAGMQNSDYWNNEGNRLNWAQLEQNDAQFQANLEHDILMANLSNKFNQQGQVQGYAWNMVESYINNGQMPPESLLQMLGLTPEWVQGLMPPEQPTGGSGHGGGDDKTPPPHFDDTVPDWWTQYLLDNGLQNTMLYLQHKPGSNTNYMQ